MKIIIKDRYTNNIKIETEAESLREVCEKNKVNLYCTNLRGADLRGADLRGANFQWTNLRDANLWKTDLRDANFSNANLFNANVYGTKIKITQKEELLKALHIKIKK